jgi:hypothetical protein
VVVRRTNCNLPDEAIRADGVKAEDPAQRPESRPQTGEYLTMQRPAWTPSRHPTFLPSA